MNIAKVFGTMIEVQWQPVNCTHRNGNIMLYLVQYEALGSSNTITAKGEQTTISNLMSSTTYFIKVAAVNSAGTGEFSPAIMAVTKPSKLIMWFGFKHSVLHLHFLICIHIYYVVYVVMGHVIYLQWSNILIRRCVYQFK